MPKNSKPENAPFFDYLNLKQENFNKTRLIVFTGKSGAGKSTYIQFLTKHNASLKNQTIHSYASRPMNWKTIKDKNKTLVIDEIKETIELYYIIKLLIKGNTLLVANHAPIFLFRLISLFTFVKIFRIDNQAKKITHYLNSHGYRYSQAAIDAFCKAFGSNYKMLEIILETGSKPDFNEIYYRFIRFNKIRTQI